ncbi:MAG: hypothetical protein JKY37_31850 [Nannocystaceae bacterium]|nr:hypothetical protein [Nannocystaceae bacterium]
MGNARLGIVWVFGLLAACGGSDPEERHGSIDLDFRNAGGSGENPFAGTATVVASLTYDTCILDLYRSPSWRVDGTEGQAVFGEWAEGELCDRSEVQCTIDAIEQIPGDGSGVLRVTYAVESEVGNHALAFGPLPTRALTGCEPTVSISSSTAVAGFDAGGEPLWQIVSFRPSKATTNQGAAMFLDIGPAD